MLSNFSWPLYTIVCREKKLERVETDVETYQHNETKIIIVLRSVTG